MGSAIAPLYVIAKLVVIIISYLVIADISTFNVEALRIALFCINVLDNIVPVVFFSLLKSFAKSFFTQKGVMYLI